MNIITIIPTYYPNQILPTQLLYSQPTTNAYPLISRKSSIIEVLSQALRASIISYENVFLVSNQRKSEEKSEQGLAVAVKQAVKQSAIETRELKQRKQKIQSKQKAICKQQEPFIIKKAEKQGKDSSQHITSGSELSQSKVNKQTKKTQQPSHHIKQDKTKLKRKQDYIKLSNVNPIQAAEVPKLGMKTSIIAKIRESLLQRRVMVWDQRLKNRREKREIRMLNF